MSQDRRGFLKSLITGGAAAALPGALKAEEPKVVVKTETKVVEKIVREKFPQNVTQEEMAIWLTITAKRRRDREARRLAKYQENA